MSEKNNDAREMSRRNMLSTTAAGIGAAGLASVALGAPRRRIRLPRRRSGNRQSMGVVQPLRPPTREERQIANEIAARVKQEIALAVMHPTTRFPAGSYAAVAQSALRSRPKLQARMRKQAVKMKRSISKARTLGVSGQVVLSASAKKRALRKSLAVIVKKSPKLIFKKVPTFKKRPKFRPKFDFSALFYNKVGFYLKRVKCKEETDEVGSDEILLGGQGIDPTGKIIKIPKWKVSNDFDKGETVSYSPHRKVVEFDLRAGKNWPKPYIMTLVMGEEDGGGFYSFLKKVWDKVGKEVTAAITAAAGAAIGSAVPGLGTVIGFVIGALAGWLIGLFNNKDDLVAIRSWTLWLGQRHRPYLQSIPGLTYKNDQFIAKPGKMHFVGDGGHYDAELYWKVTK